MNQPLRLAVIAVGLLNIGLGLMFLVRPEWMAAQFYLTPVGSQGLATIRADFTGFFLTGGAFALLAVRLGRTDALAVPVMLLSVALFGRFVSLIFDGVSASAFPPMILEAVMIGILYASMRRPQRLR
jgi:hypothetical protein